MSDKDERPAEETPDAVSQGDETEIRPLPDGGLGENMPDWLRRPPAWRVLPASALPAFVPDPVTTTPPRELPPEDTSVIEPTSLIDFDDLPRWLRELGTQRLVRLDEDAPPAETAAMDGVATDAPAPVELDADPGTVSQAPPAPEDIDGSSVAEEPSAPPPVSSEAIPATGPAVVAPLSEDVTVERDDTESKQPVPGREMQFWQRGEVVLLLVAALLVAVVVAILFATNVF